MVAIIRRLTKEIIGNIIDYFLNCQKKGKRKRKKKVKYHIKLAQNGSPQFSPRTQKVKG